jgi:hypothetical protein
MMVWKHQTSVSIEEASLTICPYFVRRAWGKRGWILILPFSSSGDHQRILEIESESIALAK